MRKIRPDEETARVAAVTVLLWGIAVAAATIEGVFRNLSDPTFAALALFATLYAPAAYRLDRRIHELVMSRSPREMANATAALDVVLVIAYAAKVPWSMLAFFGLPLAVVAHLALGERLYRARLKSARATSPGGSPAAT